MTGPGIKGRLGEADIRDLAMSSTNGRIEALRSMNVLMLTQPFCHAVYEYVESSDLMAWATKWMIYYIMLTSPRPQRYQTVESTRRTRISTELVLSR
ncbi:hypothetical protein J6590_060694 [Homalodisca vitripennis]|nr:hypothetical protein J6590_060694 [Homalodisca vitripennis]